MLRGLKVSGIVFILLLSVFGFLEQFNNTEIEVEANTLYVGPEQDYTTIQDAIDAAEPGDTIFIDNGTYYEHLEISKSITIVGSDRDDTIINGNGTGDVIYINAVEVNITRLAVTGSGGGVSDSGVKIIGSQDCSIYNCSIYSNTILGISVNNSENIRIENSYIADNPVGIYSNLSSKIFTTNNVIERNIEGIMLEYTNFSNITNNIFFRNDEHGILINQVEGIIINNNAIFGQNYYDIHIKDSKNNIIQNNTPLGETKTTGVVWWNRRGIYLEYSNYNLIINNNVSNTNQGIKIINSDSSKLISNSFLNYYENIAISFSNNNTVVNNVCETTTIYSYNNRGIELYQTCSNIILNNTLVSGGFFLKGDHLRHWNTHVFDNNTVNGKPVYYLGNSKNNTIPPGAGQIILANCTNITIKNQNLSNIVVGISLGFSNSNIIVNNTLNSNDNYGIYLYLSNYNIITNNSVVNNFWEGIELLNCSNNIIRDNLVTLNFYAIAILESKNNKLINNNITANEWIGILISDSQGDNIINNSISNNGFGINLVSSKDQLVLNNTLLSNMRGILLTESRNITLRNNQMSTECISINGETIEDWTMHNIDTSNLVIGKPVYYWKNRIGGTLPIDVGQIILANCTGLTIENQNISKANKGIQLGFSSLNKICNNIFISNYRNTIQLDYSHDNLIYNNNILNSGEGIQISYSSNNTVFNNFIINSTIGIYLKDSGPKNTITNNDMKSNHIAINLIDSEINGVENNLLFDNNDGLRIVSSSKNIIRNNTFFSNNDHGIILEHGCKENFVFHNNFLNNHYQACDNTGKNYWHNNYPSGGNYWGDYTGVDNYNGLNQDIFGADGIGDTPYKNLHSEYGSYDISPDKYPLMEPLNKSIKISLPPIAPHNFVVLPGDRYVNLSWSKPSFDGGSPITGYIIYRHFRIVNESIEITKVPADVFNYNDTNVTNGCFYHYYIAAENKVGIGPNTASITANPHIMPDPETETNKEDKKDEDDPGFHLRYILLSIILLSVLVVLIIHLLSRMKSKSQGPKEKEPFKKADESETDKPGNNKPKPPNNFNRNNNNY